MLCCNERGYCGISLHVVRYRRCSRHLLPESRRLAVLQVLVLRLRVGSSQNCSSHVSCHRNAQHSHIACQLQYRTRVPVGIPPERFDDVSVQNLQPWRVTDTWFHPRTFGVKVCDVLTAMSKTFCSFGAVECVAAAAVISCTDRL